MASEKRLLNRLRSVDDPALGVDVVTLGLVTDVRVEDGAAAVTLAFDAPLSPAEWTMCDEVRACCRGLGLDPRIYADADRDRALAPGVKNAVGICADDREAGAGLVTANLAAALASIGARVGIFDLRFDGGERTVDGGERTGGGVERTVDGVERTGRDDDRTAEGDGRTADGTVRTWVDAVDPPSLSSESIVPPVERGVPVVRLGPVLPSGDSPPAGDVVFEFVVPSVVEALEWGRLDYLLVTLPAWGGRAAELVLEHVPTDGTVVVSSAGTDSERLRAGVRELRALETTVLGAVGTFSSDGAGAAREWRVGDPEPGCPNLGLVPLDRCALPPNAVEDRPGSSPDSIPGDGDHAPYRELALSVADRVGAAKRQSVVRRQLA